MFEEWADKVVVESFEGCTYEDDSKGIFGVYYTKLDVNI